MAKRRRLSAPDADALRELEDGFATKPRTNRSATPPIAQVAGEAASLAGMAGVADRAELARDKADATRLREADAAGLLAEAIPIDQIDSDYIRRDRVIDDKEAAEELVTSLRLNGLRTPIEVAKTDDGYGLISGHRRLNAFRTLASTDQAFSRIPAFVRRAQQSEHAYIRMVEENEVRANLTPYERGRISVLASAQGVFPTVEAAVDALFSAASKAKRAKVRKFATVHESLGDLLQFPTKLTEKSGLRIADGLAAGLQQTLRTALDNGEPQNPAEEWGVLKEVLDANPGRKSSSRGGRPTQVVRLDPIVLKNGGEIRGEISGDVLRVEMKGREIDPEEARRILEEIERKFG